MVNTLDKIQLREFIFKIGYKKNYTINSETPVTTRDGEYMRERIDIAFLKKSDYGLKPDGRVARAFYIKIDSGEVEKNDNIKSREKDIKLVSQAGKGYILTKSECGKKLYESTLKILNSTYNYNNVEIYTWEEYISQANNLH